MWNILLPPNAHVAFPSTKQVFISSFKTWFLFLTIKKPLFYPLAISRGSIPQREKKRCEKVWKFHAHQSIYNTESERKGEERMELFRPQTEFPSLEEKFDRTVWKKKESVKFLSKERYRWISRIGVKERGILFWLGNWCCFHGWSGD